MLLRKILAVTLVLGFAACSNKTGKKASGLADEHNSLGAWLTTAHPNSDWAPQDLDVFEGKLNRYEQIESQLFRMDGKDGVSIRGGRNDRFILFKRWELKRARQGPDATFDTPTPTRKRVGLETPVEGSDLNDELIQPAAESDLFVDDVDAGQQTAL